MAGKPKAIPVTTIRAQAAAHAAGFTHWDQAPILNFDWVVDGEFYHGVERRNPRKAASTVRHACQTLRDRLTCQLVQTPALSLEYTRLELGLVCPSWVCDHDDGAWTECSDLDAALDTIWTEGRIA